jgi:antitoxin FitA
VITITLKDIPPRLHRELKTRAETHGRSLNTEIIACLETSTHSSPVDVEALLTRARAVRSSVKMRLTQRDLATLKAAGRP